MRRAAALIALLSTSCATMEHKLDRVDPAIPASWTAGSPSLAESEAALPAVTYKQIFTDPRLQTLIEQALVNNRDLMTAAANVAAAREQVRIQRAQQFPQLNGSAGVTLTGERSSSSSGSSSGSGNSKSGVSADYTAGLGVPNFEVDLFGRLRSLTHVQLERYLATEAGARSTRLTLVSDIASAWLNPFSRCLRAAACRSSRTTSARRWLCRCRGRSATRIWSRARRRFLRSPTRTFSATRVCRP